MRRALLLLALAAPAPAARADVKPHPLFSDHMVLQRGAPIAVWGTAAPGEDVVAQLDLPAAGNVGESLAAEAKADDQGNWSVTFPKQKAGTGYTLTLRGKNTLTFKNVAVGDVWVCSGQSNMQWEFWRLTKDDQGKKVSADATNANIRLFTVPRRPSHKPEADFPRTSTTRKEKDNDKTFTAHFGKWEECKPEAVYEFSAVAYYFGRDVQATQRVPVGLLATNWGGTVCEAWASKEALADNPTTKYLADGFTKATTDYDPEKARAEYAEQMRKWKEKAEQAKKDGKTADAPPLPPRPVVHQNLATALFNGMIHPLLKFPVAGAIWYQGESNAGRAKEYRTLFPVMIEDWRKQWKSDLPFFAVQLAPFQGGKSGVDYAELRDAQFAATKLPKVGLAVITDAGDLTDIHPQQKEPAGARLALAARALAYGEKVEYSGPVFKAMAVEGDKAVLTFTHADGLTAKGDALAGFTVCGDDKVFHPTEAKVVGATVVVTCDKVTKPVAVRYGWVNFAKPTLNLFNKAGLPAVPFRTDDFPLTTR